MIRHPSAKLFEAFNAAAAAAITAARPIPRWGVPQRTYTPASDNCRLQGGGMEKGGSIRATATPPWGLG